MLLGTAQDELEHTDSDVKEIEILGPPSYHHHEFYHGNIRTVKYFTFTRKLQMVSTFPSTLHIHMK